jgi:5-bromo-4-chloroindolyl phosphate hydrolysis protein
VSSDAQAGLPLDARLLHEGVDRLQNNWEKGWQSATAAVLAVLFILVLALLLRSQHLRVKDKDKAEEKLIALVRESAAQAAESGKQSLLAQYALEAMRTSLEEARNKLDALERVVRELRPRGKPRSEVPP